MLLPYLIHEWQMPMEESVNIFQKLLDGKTTAAIFALPNKQGTPRWSIG